MRRIAEEDLFKSYVVKIRQVLSKAAKMNRVAINRWLVRDPEDVLIIAKKFPTSVHIMLPHFFQKKETITKKVYLRILTK